MDRPVQCSHCKKPVKVIYKEIVDKTITRTEMCADCPVLQQKLYGETSAGPAEKGTFSKDSGLCCGNCRTTYESVKTGNPLGCKECYSVFADLLTTQLLEAGSIPARMKKNLLMKRGQTIHVGKSPEMAPSIGASSRILTLNEELNEALKKENYEHAAWIRDQIKALTKKDHEG
jgi:protein arginine kinase activator